jgi:CheY-like chemotaxis protein
MATILLVDDDIALVGILGLLIAAEGHLVRTATNGRDALSLALEGRPDIVVTDCAMPVMDGISLVREMRQIAELASLPVILTSDARQRPQVKVFAFLRKPFPVTALLRQLDRLNRRQSTRKAGVFGTRSRDVLMSAAMYVSARRSW